MKVGGCVLWGEGKERGNMGVEKGERVEEFEEVGEGEEDGFGRCGGEAFGKAGGKFEQGRTSANVEWA